MHETFKSCPDRNSKQWEIIVYLQKHIVSIQQNNCSTLKFLIIPLNSSEN